MGAPRPAQGLLGKRPKRASRAYMGNADTRGAADGRGAVARAIAAQTGSVVSRVPPTTSPCLGLAPRMSSPEPRLGRVVAKSTSTSDAPAPPPLGKSPHPPLALSSCWHVVLRPDVDPRPPPLATPLSFVAPAESQRFLDPTIYVRLFLHEYLPASARSPHPIQHHRGESGG